jgi:hypothetical protein
VPIRYGRMLTSPFAFYRGSANVMAADLARTPTSGMRVKLCGDAHLSNFGGFAAPDRRLVFDVNDFDETLPGPWEWDVKRLAASVAVAARDLDYARKQRLRIVGATVRAYRKTMRALASMRNLDVWYVCVEADEIIERLRAQAPKKVVGLVEHEVGHAQRARTRSRGPAAAPARLGRHARLDPSGRGRRSEPRLLRASAVGLEALARPRVGVAEGARGLRNVVRRHARPRPRAVGGSSGDSRLPRVREELR